MRRFLKTQVLQALRDSLRDLDNLKLVSADDPDVRLLREHLGRNIIQIENDGTPDEYEYEVAA
jgi:hypothetical protein